MIEDRLILAAMKQGWEDGKEYSKMLTKLKRIEADLNKLNYSIDELDEILEEENPLISSWENIYGESFVAKYKEVNNRIREIYSSSKSEFKNYFRGAEL